MRSWQSTFAALLLMLVLPLQGLAASLSPMLCHAQDEVAPASSAASGHVAHHHHDSSPPPADEPKGTDDYAGHLCCHLVFSAMPAVTAALSLLEPSAYASPDTAAPPPFVPERLRRPPRT